MTSLPDMAAEDLAREVRESAQRLAESMAWMDRAKVAKDEAQARLNAALAETERRLRTVTP